MDHKHNQLRTVGIGSMGHTHLVFTRISLRRVAVTCSDEREQGRTAQKALACCVCDGLGVLQHPTWTAVVRLHETAQVCTPPNMPLFSLLLGVDPYIGKSPYIRTRSPRESARWLVVVAVQLCSLLLKIQPTLHTPHPTPHTSHITHTTFPFPCSSTRRIDEPVANTQHHTRPTQQT